MSDDERSPKVEIPPTQWVPLTRPQKPAGEPSQLRQPTLTPEPIPKSSLVPPAQPAAPPAAAPPFTPARAMEGFAVPSGPAQRELAAQETSQYKLIAGLLFVAVVMLLIVVVGLMLTVM